MKSSIAIVTRNRAHMLNRVLKSILRSDILPNEIIIIDNGSEDNTKEVISGFTSKHNDLTIRYYYESNIGISYARNKALTLSKGDVVAFTDDDCIVHKEWLKNILIFFKNNDSAIAVGGYTGSIKNSIFGMVGHLHRKYMTYKDVYEPVKHSQISQLNNMISPQILSNEHYMVSLATQNIAYKTKAIANLRFTENLDPCEATGFSWKLFKISHKSIVYSPNIVTFHEYKSDFLGLLKTNFFYGYKTVFLKNHANINLYFPRHLKTSYFKKLVDYLIFSFVQSKRYSTGIMSFTFLFLLMILREFVFDIGMIIGYFFGDFRLVKKAEM